MVFSSIPQVITEDRASGAQFTEGSLRFDSGKSQHLKRTYNSAGNRRFWTWSAWVKRGSIPSSNVAQSLFGAYYNSSSRDVIRIGGEVQDSLSYQNGNSGDYDSSTTSAVLRDTGWYHFVVSVDLNQGTQTDRVKIYVNGELQSKSNDAQATRDSFINWEGAHFIGARSTDGTGSAFWDGGMSQVYFIDGQALGPEEFGYTDPLTNTWRSKKFEHLSTSIATQYSGASALTWDDNPIGSVYTLSNGNRTATAGGGGNGYSGADVWSNAIPANSTTAWTLEITNSDTVGGWYFTDSQTASGTHPDERGGNSLGMRNQDADAGWFGTFATANGGSNQGHVLPLLSCHTWGSKRVDFVVYRPASGNGKVWVKNNGSSTWVGGGNPSDTSSTPSFVIPDGNTYFGYTFYDRGNGDQVATFDGDGSIQQKIGANSFYLPMDGNSPIGEDKSGKGNNWTPINFGGSNSLEKSTGALPILNTLSGGTQASVGVFGSKEGFFETVSSSSGGGNPYIFDGRGTQPTLRFIRGATYVFDYSSATSHPLRFATAADAAGSTEYTTGTSISGNVISFTVPHDAPATLYYYCTNHSGMGNSISVTTDETKADKYASNCVLALPLLSSTNDVSTSIGCTSTTKTVAANGAVASNNASNFYSGSYYFDGSNDFINVTAQSELSLQGDFTIECWTLIDTNVSNGKQISSLGYYINGKAGNWYFGLSSAGGYEIVFYTYDGQSSAEFVSANLGAPQIDKWYHIAAVRIGLVVTLYVDGVSKASGNISKGLNNGGVDGLTLGRISQNGGSGAYGTLNGYIQDLRIYNGVGKYTGNFIPASTNPDILPDTPSGVSGSSKLAKITDGAVAFDGSGDYLSGFGGSAILPTSTGTAFVVDCFWYSNGNSSQKGIWEQHSSGSGRTGYFVNNGSVFLISEGNTVGTFTYGDKRWYFTRIIYDGSGNIYHYVNGVLIASGTQSNGVDNTGFQIGAFATDCFNGFISNFRIVVGANSLSGTNIPTSPLTNITNTALLCCQSNASAIAAAVTPGTITANGNAAATTFNPFNTDINTVRGQESGYCTLNPLDKRSNVTLSNGNLDVTTTNSHWSGVKGTLSVNSGKYYFEEIADGADANKMFFGICASDVLIDPSSYVQDDTTERSKGMLIFCDDGQYQLDASSRTSYGSALTNGDVLAIAIDLDGNTVEFYKNGKPLGSIDISGSPLSTTTVVPLYVHYNSNTTYHLNFGQKPFKFPPPDGFQPLNHTTIRPETVIARPDQYVGTSLYTGNGGTLSVINLNFKPDLVWIKCRSHADDHTLTDSVRGADRALYSNNTNEENVSSIRLQSFNNDGFTTGSSGDTNTSGRTFCAWTWKAGGNKNTFNVDDVGYTNASDVNMNVGGLNSSSFNQSQTWTNSLSISGSWDSGGVVPANAFDGSLATNARAMGQNQQITFDISSSPLTFTDKVEFYHTHFGADVRVNGGTVIGNPPINEFVTIASGGGTLNTITFVNANSKSEVTAIRVDGKLLVDPGINLPSIAATGCSVGTKQGFSIVKWTDSGANTIAHGLGSPLNFYIVKRYDGTSDWSVYHTSLGGPNKRLHLNSTSDALTGGSWSNTAPTSSVFSWNGGTGDDMVAYCWHDVPGLQKFGIYSGNGSSNGPIIELGFKPAVLWAKCATGGAGDWIIKDSTRYPANREDIGNTLVANVSNSEDGYYNANQVQVDLLSNGFKIRHSGGPLNDSGRTYIYCAWAESPTVNLFGAQSNAR